MGALVSDREMSGDVIVAPATPPGASALAVVRFSGPAGAALAVARKLAPSLPEKPSPRHALLCSLVDSEGAAVKLALAQQIRDGLTSAPARCQVEEPTFV